MFSTPTLVAPFIEEIGLAIFTGPIAMIAAAAIHDRS